MIVLSALLALLLTVLAQDAPSSPIARLVTFDQLVRDLDDVDLLVLDVRPKAAYELGHIPGSILVDPKEIEDLSKRPGSLTNASLWTAYLEPLGLRADTRVIVYDDNRQLDAARVWWLLTYLGVPSVSLLDGNFSLWKSQDHPVADTTTPPRTPAIFKVAVREDSHAPRDEVKAALTDHSSQILDARSDPEYSGDELRSKRGGHIPGACHLEWVNMVDEQGRFRPLAELQTKLEAAGIKKNLPVISHCQGGGRASVNAFVLELLGYKTRNYYLGWSDWGNTDDVPVSTAPQTP